MRGGGGDDVLLGGSGGDILSGGDADDVLSSGGGNDALLGGGGQNVTLGGPLSSEPDAATAPMAGDPVQPADAELASSTDTTDAELQDPPVEQLTPAGQVDEEATAMETPAAAEASQELETDTAQEGDGNSSGVDPSTDDTTADSDSSTPCHLPSAVSANESAAHHAHGPRLGAPRWVASAAFRRWTPTPVCAALRGRRPYRERDFRGRDADCRGCRNRLPGLGTGRVACGGRHSSEPDRCGCDASRRGGCIRLPGVAAEPSRP